MVTCVNRDFYFGKQNKYTHKIKYNIYILQLKSLQHKSIFKNFNVRWDYSRSQSWFLLRHLDVRVRILHKEHESMDPSCLVSTVQAGGGGVMVWGIFSWHTLGPLVPIEYIYIYAVKVNALTQIYFNGTNFINAARIFCLTHGPSRSWRNGDAQCCQLSSIADPFSYFFPFEKVPKPFHFWKSPVLLHERQVLLSQRTHTILSLSVGLHCSASGGER